MGEIQLSRWLFEADQECAARWAKRNHENSISSIFMESPHQVDMKSIVKCRKDFLWYFTTPKTYPVLL